VLVVVPPLVEPASHRPLQADDLGFQSGVPGDLPLPPQPVLQAYFILNAGRYRRPWVVTRETLGSRCRQSLQNGAGEVLNARVDCIPVVQFRTERNLIFQVSLEVGPVSAPEIRAIRWVLNGRATRSVNEYMEVVPAYCRARGQIHREREALHCRDVQDIGSSGGVVWVGGWGVRSKDQTGVLVGIITEDFPPSRVQPRVPIHVFGVEVAGHQDRQSSAETGGQVCSDQWAERREVSRKDLHWSAGHYNLDGSSLQVGQAQNGH